MEKSLFPCLDSFERSNSSLNDFLQKIGQNGFLLDGVQKASFSLV